MMRYPTLQRDNARVQLGNEIERLRNMRKWTRAKLVDRLRDELDPDFPNYESISESWLARLERDETVNVPRQVIESLCQALICSDQERARVIYYADRNILAHSTVMSDTMAVTINNVIDILHREAFEILVDGMVNPRAETLTEQESIELVYTALELVLRRRRQR